MIETLIYSILGTGLGVGFFWCLAQIGWKSQDVANRVKDAHEYEEKQLIGDNGDPLPGKKEEYQNLRARNYQEYKSVQNYGGWLMIAFFGVVIILIAILDNSTY